MFLENVYFKMYCAQAGCNNSCLPVFTLNSNSEFIESNFGASRMKTLEIDMDLCNEHELIQSFIQ